MSLQQWLKSGSIKVKAPVTPGLPDPSKRYVFAKLHTRSQNLNYNSLHSTGTWHAINDTYKIKKVALNSKEKKVWNFKHHVSTN